LFDNHARPVATFFLGQTALGQHLSDRGKKTGRDREIKKAIAESVVLLVSFVDLLFQTLVSLRLQKIAFDVVNTLDHRGPELRIEWRRGELGNFFSQHLSKAGSVKVVAGEADDCELFGQDIVLSEVAERGDELTLGEIAGGAEN